MVYLDMKLRFSLLAEVKIVGCLISHHYYQIIVWLFLIYKIDMYFAIG